MKKLILVSGKSNSGKGKFVDFIKSNLELQNQKVIIIPCAKYIKSYLKDYYNWDGVEKTDEIRSLLQYLGTDKIREELNMPNFHIQRVCEDICILEDDFDYFITDDVRFINELTIPKDIFGDKVIDVRIERNNFESPLTIEQQLHISETSLDDFKFSHYIENASLIELELSANKFVEEYLK